MNCVLVHIHIHYVKPSDYIVVCIYVYANTRSIVLTCNANTIWFDLIKRLRVSFRIATCRVTVELRLRFVSLAKLCIEYERIYRITSIKDARRGSISKRGALNRIKSSIIQSVIALRTKLAILGLSRKPVTVCQKRVCFSRSQTRFFAAKSFVLCERTFHYDFIHV
jgi:hypothetical protein